MSLLSDVNSWEQFGSLDAIEMVDLINNEVIMQACCDAINEAIQECPDIADTIIDILVNSDVFNDYIKQLIQDMLTQNGGAYGALADVNDLDYVWGGLLYALNEYEDSVNGFEIAATGAANIVEFVSNIPGIEFIQSQGLESVKTALDFGTVAVLAYLNDNDTKNQFLCGIFDQICGRGPEYGILPGDIQFGWENIDAGASSPIPSISDVVKLFFSNDKFIQLFAIGSDTPDNNWDSLCGCEQTWEYVVDWDNLPSWIQVANGIVQADGVQGKVAVPPPGYNFNVTFDCSWADSVTYVEYTYDRTNATGGTGTDYRDAIRQDDPQIDLLLNTNVQNGTGINRLWTGTAYGTIRIFAITWTVNPISYNGDLFLYDGVKLKGTGPQPPA